MLLAAAVEGGLGLLAVTAGWLTGNQPLSDCYWRPDALATGVAAACPLLAVFVLTFRWPVGPLRRIRQFLIEVAGPLFQDCRLVELALIAALAGFGEELFFRGLLQSAGIRWLGTPLGLTLASALFGLAHAITATYAVGAAVMGAYFGWLVLSTGNLLVPVSAHAAYDFFALACIVRFCRQSAAISSVAETTEPAGVVLESSDEVPVAGPDPVDLPADEEQTERRKQP